MKKIEFSNNSGRVRLCWDFDGDYIVSVLAEAHGFRGHADGHVEQREFRSFANSVVNLATSRKGEAKLTSAFPEFFDVEIRSVDSVGHLGVFGSLNFGTSNEFDERQSLQFSLHFEPAQIENAADALRKFAT